MSSSFWMTACDLDSPFTPIACHLKGLFFATASLVPMIIFILNSNNSPAKNAIRTRGTIQRSAAIEHAEREKLTLNNPNVFPTWNFRHFAEISPLVLGHSRRKFGGWPWNCSRGIHLPEGIFLPRTSATCGTACNRKRAIKNTKENPNPRKLLLNRNRRTIVFFGDSHVMALNEGVLYLTRRFPRICFLMVGTPSGYPIFTGKLSARTQRLRHVAEKANKYGKTFRDFLPALNPDLTHVFVGSRWDWYLREFSFSPHVTHPLLPLPFNLTDDRMTEFAQGIADLFQHLRSQRFTVTFLGMVPELSITAVREGFTCARRKNGIIPIANYSEPLSNHESSPSRQIFLIFAERFGTAGFNFIDPLPLFCDSRSLMCSTMFKRMCSYWDDTHISPVGSMLYGKLLELYIKSKLE